MKVNRWRMRKARERRAEEDRKVRTKADHKIPRNEPAERTMHPDWFALGVALMSPYTHNGHAPVVTRPDPADESTDACSDAAKIIAAAMVNNQECGFSCDNECLEEVGPDYVEFELPKMRVRVERTVHHRFANQIAQWALEQAGLRLLAASREAAVVK